MSAAIRPRVYFEPKVEPHAPELYAFEGIARGVEGLAAVDDAALGGFAEQGFLLVHGLLTPAEVRAARDELVAMTLSDAPDCDMIWYEGILRDHLRLAGERDRGVDGSDAGRLALGQEGTSLPPLERGLRGRLVRKFMGFVDGHPPLAAVAYHAGLLDLVARLLGGRAPELFQDMALVKPPRGREKPWHQDHAYFNLALDTPIVGVWIPFEEVTPANGCMHVLAGGHRAGPRVHFKRRDWQICDGDMDAAGRLAVPMRAGDALLFDGKLPHGTPTNTTDRQRWAVQFHYRPAAAQQVDDAVRLAAFGSEGKDVTC